ncbi:MAG: peptide-methionine (R)-S-oxide reductase [Deinococcales bacterium]
MASQEAVMVNASADLSQWANCQALNELLRERLTALQYQVTQEEGTEELFRMSIGIIMKGASVDIVSGEPLFSSTHKYDSGTG